MRRKYHNLKETRKNTEETLHTAFKPITSILNNIMETGGKFIHQHGIKLENIKNEDNKDNKDNIVNQNLLNMDDDDQDNINNSRPDPTLFYCAICSHPYPAAFGALQRPTRGSRP